MMKELLSFGAGLLTAKLLSKKPSEPPPEPPSPPGGPTEEKCSGTLFYKNYGLSNNKWGNPDAMTCVFYRTDEYIGTRWESNKGLIAPGAVVGTNFCKWNSTWNKFPIKWKDVNTWEVETRWQWEQYPTTTFNNSIDIYLVDWCNPPSGRGPYHVNPMIWIQRGGAFSYNPGNYIVNDGYNDYYASTPGPAVEKEERIIYMLKNPPEKDGSVKINIKKLLDQMQTILEHFKRPFSYIDGNWVIPEMHMAIENGPYQGIISKGKIFWTKYNVQLNGSTIGI